LAADIQRGGPRAGLGSRLGRPCNTRARFLDSCFVLSFTPRRLVARWSNVSVLGQGRNRLRLRSWARRVTRGPLHRVTADGNGASSSNPRAPWPPLESITGQTASSSCARTIDPCANLDAYCIEFGPRQARGAIRTILYKESISFDWDPAQLAMSAARLIDEKACRLLNKHRINQD